MPRHGGMFRGLAQSIGLAASDTGATLTRGNDREDELLHAWIKRLERQEWTTDAEEWRTYERLWRNDRR